MSFPVDNPPRSVPPKLPPNDRARAPDQPIAATEQWRGAPAALAHSAGPRPAAAPIRATLALLPRNRRSARRQRTQRPFRDGPARTTCRGCCPTSDRGARPDGGRTVNEPCRPAHPGRRASGRSSATMAGGRYGRSAPRRAAPSTPRESDPRVRRRIDGTAASLAPGAAMQENERGCLYVARTKPYRLVHPAQADGFHAGHAPRDSLASSVDKGSGSRATAAHHDQRQPGPPPDEPNERAHELGPITPSLSTRRAPPPPSRAESPPPHPRALPSARPRAASCASRGCPSPSPPTDGT